MHTTPVGLTPMTRYNVLQYRIFYSVLNIEPLQCFRWFDDTMAEVLGFDQWNFHHKEDNLECKQQSHIQQNHLMLNIEYFILFFCIIVYSNNKKSSDAGKAVIADRKSWYIYINQKPVNQILLLSTDFG